MPDTIRAIAAKADLVIRSPEATRPWQHVLEPLSGYLWLGSLLAADPQRYSSAWNFGPDEGRVYTVADVVTRLLGKFAPPATKLVVNRDNSGAEALLLQLDCTKSRQLLKWHATYDVEETLDAIVEWYRRAADGLADMGPLTVSQIKRYTSIAKQRGLAWASGTAS